MSHMLLVSHTDDTMSRRWFPRSLWGGNKSSREFCVRFLICFVVPKWRRREKEVIRIMEIKEDFMALFEKARTFSKCEIQRRVNGTDEVNYPKKNKQEKRRKKISYIYHIEGWRRKKKLVLFQTHLPGGRKKIVIIIKWFLVFIRFVSSRRARAGQQTIPLVIINNILSFFSPLFWTISSNH